MVECATPEQILKDPHTGEFEREASAIFAPAMTAVMEMIERAGYVRGAVVKSGPHEYRIERIDISASSISAYHGYIAHFAVWARRRLKNGWGWAIREQVVGDWCDLGDLTLVPPQDAQGDDDAPDLDHEATYITCPACKGSGTEPGELWPCRECKGTREVCSTCRQPPPHAEDGVVVGGCWHHY